MWCFNTNSDDIKIENVSDVNTSEILKNIDFLKSIIEHNKKIILEYKKQNNLIGKYLDSENKLIFCENLTKIENFEYQIKKQQFLIDCDKIKILPLLENNEEFVKNKLKEIIYLITNDFIHLISTNQNIFKYCYIISPNNINLPSFSYDVKFLISCFFKKRYNYTEIEKDITDILKLIELSNNFIINI